VVITTGVSKLLVVKADALADEMGLTEIEGSPFDRCYLPGRDTLRVDGDIVRCVNLHEIFLDTSLAVSAKAEEGAMGDVDGSCLVCSCEVSDDELIARGERISHRDVEVSGIALEAVGMKEVEADRAVGKRLDVPDEVIYALESAMESVMAVVIDGGMVKDAVYLELRPSDAVRDRAHAGAKEPLPRRIYVFAGGFVADDYVCGVAVPVGSRQRHYPGSKIGNFQADIACGYFVSFDFLFAGQQGKG